MRPHTARAAAFTLAAPLTVFSLLSAGCPGAAATSPGDPRGPGEGQSAGEVDPDACGEYSMSEGGRKIYAFLQATVWLQDEVHETEAYLHDTCQMMATELGMEKPTGDTQQVCTQVLEELDRSLEAGLSARDALEVGYQPAVCEVNIDAAASAAAECEGEASAEVVAECQGTCQGTCNGTCDGQCAGGADGGGAGGECNGECEGTCNGTCEGTCEGHADVEADASCQTHAEVRANTEATCTEPEIEVSYAGDVVADTERLEAAVAAIDVGMPRLLYVQARVTGPVMAAFTTWSATASELAGAGMEVAEGLGDSAMCVAGQVAAAAAAIASIEASISVQVEVSASASASVGGGA